MMGKNNPIQNAMQHIARIDNVPKDHVLILYVKERLTEELYHQLRVAVEAIRESDDISIIILPENELELRILTEDQRQDIIQRLTSEGKEGTYERA